MAKKRNSGKSGKATASIRDRNKAEICKAAIALFAAKGFEGTTIGDIAVSCGLTRTNVYYYYPDKEHIYSEIIENVIAGWDRAFEEISIDREPREAIKAYVYAKIEYSRTHAVESRFFASEILCGGKFLKRKQRLHMRQVTREWAHVIRQWISEGKLAPVDPNLFFIVLWSSTQFYAEFELVATDILNKRRLSRADFNDAAATITRVVLDGCGVSETQ